jgi:hypothetical protein
MKTSSHETASQDGPTCRNSTVPAAFHIIPLPLVVSVLKVKAAFVTISVKVLILVMNGRSVKDLVPRFNVSCQSKLIRFEQAWLVAWGFEWM